MPHLWMYSLVMLSSSFMSSSLSSILAEAAYSFTRLLLLKPGMGIAPLLISQASAICALDTPWASEILLSVSCSFELLAASLNTGSPLCALVRGDMTPARAPFASGLHAIIPKPSSTASPIRACSGALYARLYCI